MGLIDLSKFQEQGGLELSRFTESSVFSKIETRPLDSLSTIDPIHYAGGCYCWECEHRKEFFDSGHFVCTKAQCEICGAVSLFVEDDGFCSYGHRKEGADG